MYKKFEEFKRWVADNGMTLSPAQESFAKAFFGKEKIILARGYGKDYGANMLKNYLEEKQSMYKALELRTRNAVEKDLIIQTIRLYPVTHEIIKEMLMSGLEVNQINEMCRLWYENGTSIQVGWNNTRTVLAVMKNN